jgi:hypothetical protein
MRLAFPKVRSSACSTSSFLRSIAAGESGFGSGFRRNLVSASHRSENRVRLDIRVRRLILRPFRFRPKASASHLRGLRSRRSVVRISEEKRRSGPTQAFESSSGFPVSAFHSPATASAFTDRHSGINVPGLPLRFPARRFLCPFGPSAPLPNPVSPGLGGFNASGPLQSLRLT